MFRRWLNVRVMRPGYFRPASGSASLPWFLLSLCFCYILLLEDGNSPTVRRWGAPRVNYKALPDEEIGEQNVAPHIGWWSGEVTDFSAGDTPQQLYRDYKKPSAYCKKLVNIGGKGCTHKYEGNKDMCLDVEVIPPRNNCLMYSFGVADDVTFEDEVGTLLRCRTHLYDPTIYKFGWHLEKPVYPQTFHPEALGDHPAVMGMMGYLANMRTYATLLSSNGDSNATVHYLKMDIEGGEWQTLKNMVANNMLDNVVQLSMELHSLDLKTTPRHRWMTVLKERFEILLSLEKIGFRRVSVKDNEHYLCRFDFTGISINTTADAISPQTESVLEQLPVAEKSNDKDRTNDFNTSNRATSSEVIGGVDQEPKKYTKSGRTKSRKIADEGVLPRHRETASMDNLAMLGRTTKRSKLTSTDSPLTKFLKSVNVSVQEIPFALEIDFDNDNENYMQVCQEVLYVRVHKRMK